MIKPKYKLNFEYWLFLAFVPIAIGVYMNFSVWEVLGCYFGFGVAGIITAFTGHPKWFLRKK